VKILRSFPDDGGPPGRAHVVDDLERYLNRPYDYSGLKAYGDDILLLEWDIAVSRTDLGIFAQRVKGRDWPVVAPFLNRQGTHYMHWRAMTTAVEAERFRPIRKGEPDCELFGFGMVYFPAWVLRDYPPGWGNSSILSDGSLPRWLQSLPQARPVPVDWDITVVHLA
jgi:hypothetical protein